MEIIRCRAKSRRASRRALEERGDARESPHLARPAQLPMARSTEHRADPIHCYQIQCTID